MVYKFVDKYTVEPLTKNYVIIDGLITTNPTDAHKKKAGYKPIEDTEPPEYDLEKQYLVPTYKEGANKIVCNYEIKDLEE